MLTPNQVVEDYTKSASVYNNLGVSPTSLLETQLVKAALGDVTGLRVLDLGGGTGLHAREACDQGAKKVDVVDITPAMLGIGEDVEKSLGREGIIRYYEGDVSKPLDTLPLERSYDIVMANWVFDHADTLQDLEGMWKNATNYLKPGGKLISVRISNIDSSIMRSGKYGFSVKDFKPFPGGMKYTAVIHTPPTWEFEMTSMEVNYSGSYALDEKYGLVNVGIVPYDRADAVQADPEFWKPFLRAPQFAVVQGSKKMASGRSSSKM